MIGFVIGLIWFGIAAMTDANLPQTALSISNFFFWWYVGWGIFFAALLMGLVTLAGGAAGASSGSGFGAAAGAAGGGVLGALIGSIALLFYGLLAGGAMLFYNSTPDPVAATSWADFDQTKMIIAGVLFGFGILIKLFHRSSSSSSSSSSS